MDMTGMGRRLLTSVALAGILGTASTGTADTIGTKADGYQVVPTQNSGGAAAFRAKIDRDAQVIRYELSWQNLEGDIIQSHIHFGRSATNGDIVLFLCTNINNTPASATPAPTCVGPRAGSVSGVLQAGDIVAVPFGGIQPGQQLLPFESFQELADAIDAGAAYVVVHTAKQPSGELRGQIPGKHGDHD
jgi:CHRD domain-containing protein